MKRLVGIRRIALIGSALLSVPAASCSLDQAALDALLSTISGFQGTINVEVDQGGSEPSDGDEHEGQHNQGQEDQPDHEGD